MKQLESSEGRKVKTPGHQADPICSKLGCLLIGLIASSLLLLVVTVRISMELVSCNLRDPREERKQTSNATMIQSKDPECYAIDELNIANEKLNCIKKVLSDTECVTKCPFGWISVDGKCYFFSADKKTRQESNEFCKSNGAELATVKRKDTMLQSHINTLGSAFWIGLTPKVKQYYQRMVTRWYWPDGSVEVFQSNHQDGFCATIKQTFGESPCTDFLQWICDKKPEISDLHERVKHCEV
ncbi:C-type lectin domain family 2 member B-like [Discoglossus pictus]